MAKSDVLTDWYCQKCGAKDVWQDPEAGGDYYHDCTGTCRTCQHTTCCLPYVSDELRARAKHAGSGPSGKPS